MRLDEGEEQATDASELVHFTFNGSTYAVFTLVTPLVLPAVPSSDPAVYDLALDTNVVEDDTVQNALSETYEKLLFIEAE